MPRPSPPPAFARLQYATACTYGVMCTMMSEGRHTGQCLRKNLMSLPCKRAILAMAMVAETFPREHQYSHTRDNVLVPFPFCICILDTGGGEHLGTGLQLTSY